MTSFLSRDKGFPVVVALDLLCLGGFYHLYELKGPEVDGFIVVTFLLSELDAYASQLALPGNVAVKMSS